MRLAGRIPVEPLDEERLLNIERRVVAAAADAAVRSEGLRTPRRHIATAVAAFALVAAGFVGWALRGAPQAPVVAGSAPIRVETALQRSMLDIGDARIESDPATVFAVTRPEGGVLISMTRGKVELEVGARGTRPPLIVRAGEADVVVVGTHFTVDYGDGRGDVIVRVREGVVRVVHRDRETRVAAGQEWQTQAGLVASAGGTSSEPARAVPASGDDRGSAARGSDDVAIARAVPEVLHDHVAVVPDAPAVVAAPPAHNPAPSPRPHGRDAVRPHTPVRPSHPLSELITAIRAQHVEPALDIGEANATSAIAKYYDIAAHRSGVEASQAFYSIAVIRHLKLALNADALLTLDAYIRRFPGGKEYRAVLWLRVRILCLAKVDDRCRAAAYTYLHEAPDSPAAGIAERLTLTE